MKCEELESTIIKYWSEDLSTGDLADFIQHIIKCDNCCTEAYKIDPSISLLWLSEEINSSHLNAETKESSHIENEIKRFLRFRKLSLASALVAIILFIIFIFNNNLQAPAKPLRQSEIASRLATDERQNESSTGNIGRKESIKGINEFPFADRSFSIISNLETDGKDVLQFRLDKNTEIVMIIDWQD